MPEHGNNQPGSVPTRPLKGVASLTLDSGVQTGS